ncbi:MAG: DMT family transporter [Lachnospiraceae bacterium]|nr:DMT family transporter [Lachnospiraceae bacterium]MBQ7775821.1 DMT family transporter [Lachnospiraceae bacterium]
MINQTNDKKNFITRPLGIGLLACLCCLLWGSATPAIKIGYEWFGIGASDIASRILFAGVRFVLAGVLTVIFGSLIAGKTLIPQKSSWSMICKLGLVQTVFQYIFFYMGLAYTTGVKSAIINGSQTFIAILMACLIFRYEKLTMQKFWGCLIGFAGVVVINFDPSGLAGGFTFRGEGAILIAAIAYALSSALVKRYSQKESPVVLSGYQFVFGGIIMTICGFLMGGQLAGWCLKSVVLLIYMALISSVAYSVWGILLKHNPVGKVAVYSFTNPIFSVLLSFVFLGESSSFGVELLLALALVCGGIYLVNRVNE